MAGLRIEVFRADSKRDWARAQSQSFAATKGNVVGIAIYPGRRNSVVIQCDLGRSRWLPVCTEPIQIISELDDQFDGGRNRREVICG